MVFSLQKNNETCQFDDKEIKYCDVTTNESVKTERQSQTMFLQNFLLQNINIPLTSSEQNSDVVVVNNKILGCKLRRNSSDMKKYTAIPFSSPAGMHLLKTLRVAKTNVYVAERLQRLERFCPAPSLRNAGRKKPKFMQMRLNKRYRKSLCPPKYCIKWNERISNIIEKSLCSELPRIHLKKLTMDDVVLLAKISQ